MHVVQGERDLVNDCRSLARFELRGIPPMVAGAARIEVVFNVDADGILDVSAKETMTGVTANVQVKPSYGLDEAEITQMLKASYSYASEDRDARMLAEQCVEANGLVDAVEIALAQDGHLLNDAERAEIDTAIKQVTIVALQSDASAISDAVAALGRVTDTFATRRMDQSIRSALQGKSIDDVVDGSL